MVDIEPDADLFADGMVVVGRHQRQYLRPGGQAQGVEKLSAAKGFCDDLGFHFAIIVMDHVVTFQQGQ